MNKRITHDLSDFVEAMASEFGIPGVAVGVWADGQETYACRGVTSLDNPLPVDRDTLFLLGSISKTLTATALMRLVVEQQVELDAPVRRYVPELRLADERATADVTVLNLLNHTSGLDWDLLVETGEGDDALAEYVSRLAELPLVAPPGVFGARRHDPAVRRGAQPRRGRHAVRLAAVEGPTLPEPRRGPRVLGGGPASVGAVPAQRWSR